jgi:hypothetical protein
MSNDPGIGTQVAQQATCRISQHFQEFPDCDVENGWRIVFLAQDIVIVAFGEELDCLPVIGERQNPDDSSTVAHNQGTQRQTRAERLPESANPIELLKNPGLRTVPQAFPMV